MNKGSLCPASDRGSLSQKSDLFFEQQLRDLHGVGRRALAYLVAAAPEVQPALVGQIVADAADVDEVLIARVERHGVDLARKVVGQLAAGRGGATTYITPIIAILVTTIAQACVWPMYRDLFGPKNLFERLD